MWHQRLWIIAVLCIAVLAIVDDAEAGKKKKAERKASRRQAQEQADIDAGWVFEECVPRRRRSCGRGTKTGTLQGQDGQEPQTKTRKCLVPCAEGEEGGRRANRRQGRRQGRGCKYSRGEWSECAAESNTISRTLTLKKGGDECEQTKTVTRPCTANQKKNKKRTGCKYTKGEWSECDTEGMMSRTLSRRRGDPSECEESKTVTKKCRPKCKYDRKKNVEWSACDTTTNTMSKTLNLRKGPSTCEPTKTLSKKCRGQGCMYNRGKWSKCDINTGMVTKARTLRRGDPTMCPLFSFTKMKCGKECKYDRKSGIPWSACDFKHTMSKVLNLRKGPSTCPRTKTFTKACHSRGCTYTKGQWSKCDTNTGMVTKTRTLRHGDITKCPLFSYVKKKCGKECKYDRKRGIPWSECDFKHTMSKVLNLRKGPSTCPRTKTITKACHGRGCKYDKEQWSKCDPNTGTVTKTRTLRRGDPTKCPKAMIISRKCGEECTYDHKKSSSWSECASNNTESKVLTLRKGPSTCPATRTVSRPCHKRATKCRYDRGRWSECDPVTKAKTRYDTIKAEPNLPQPSTCPPTRAVTKICKKTQFNKRRCRYVKGQWAECVDGQRSLTMTLSPRSDSSACEASKTISRPCTARNGKAKCFYGMWTKFGECTNGVRTKTRPIVDGGERCQKKAVKTKPC